MTIISSENSFEPKDDAQLGARMNAYWPVVCILKDCSAEIGLARQRTLADELTSQSATPALMIWRCQPLCSSHVRRRACLVLRTLPPRCGLLGGQYCSARAEAEPAPLDQEPCRLL